MSPAYSAGTFNTKAPLSQNITITPAAEVDDWTIM